MRIPPVLALLALATPALAQTCPTPVGVPTGPWTSLFLQVDNHGGPVYFSGGLPFTVGRELHRWDPVGGVVQLTNQPGSADGINSYPVPLWVGGERRVFFNGITGATGEEPFVSDGTPAGTVLLKDVKAGSGSSRPREFVGAGGTIYFSAETPTARLLHKTDGTTAGTQLVKSVAAGGPTDVRWLTPFGDRLLFAGRSPSSGEELWISDGTVAGTTALGDLNPGASSSAPLDITPIGERAVFMAETGPLGIELHVTDGTVAGTGLLMDVNPGSGDSVSLFQQQDFAVWRGEAYFGADDGVHGFELWKTDGTPAGTQLVADLTPGPGSSNLGSLTPAGDTFYFANEAGAPLGGVWSLSSGGTLTQIGFVKPVLSVSTLPRIVPADGGIYYFGTLGVTGVELFYANTAGMSLVCDLVPGPGSASGASLQIVGERLVFGAVNGTGSFEPHWLALAGGHATDLGFGGGQLRFAAGAPNLGGPVSLRVDGLPSGQFGLIAYSAVVEPSPALVEAGAALWLDPLSARLIATFTTPSFETSYMLPNDPSLVGVRAHAQALGVPPTGLPFSASNGVGLVLGP